MDELKDRSRLVQSQVRLASQHGDDATPGVPGRSQPPDVEVMSQRLPVTHQRAWVRLPLRESGFATLAAVSLLAVYLGLITLAQGWGHAVQQLGEDRWFVGAIVAGFATQVGLFVYLRSLNARAATGGVAASTGTSATAMLACCAHHLIEVLPIVGLSGAAVFLNAYQTPLLWLGIVMNLAGIAYLLRKIRQQRGITRQRIRPLWFG